MLLPEVTIVNDAVQHVYRKKINGKEVLVTLNHLHTSMWSISFTVNGQYAFQNIKQPVAITRWVLKVFKHVNTYAILLVCIAFAEDGRGDYRHDIYRRLGFVQFHPNVLEELNLVPEALLYSEDCLEEVICEV